MKKLDIILWAIVGLVLLLLSAGNAWSQQQRPQCLPFEEFRSALTTMKQSLISLGMVGNSHVVMVFSAPDGQAWTIISVDTNGIACGMAAGTAWDQGRIPSSTARDA